MLIRKTRWPILIILMNPVVHRFIFTATRLRPLRRIRLSTPNHVQRQIAFSAAWVARLYRQTQDYFSGLLPFRKIRTDHLALPFFTRMPEPFT